MQHHEAHGAKRKQRSRSAKATVFFAVLLPVLIATNSAASAAEFDSSNLQNMSDGLAWYALWMCVTGILISSGMWAMGSRGQNPGQELTGKKGFIVCLTAAFFVGATPATISWLQHQADLADTDGVGFNSPATLSEMNSGNLSTTCQSDLGIVKPC